MKGYPGTRLILLASIAVCLTIGAAVAQQQRPNIIMILGDDLGNADVG